MRKIKLLLMLVAMFAGLASTYADELTVYDGTATNSYIPFYGYNADTQGIHGEFVIPSSDLSNIDGATLKGLKFYSSTTSVSWGAAVFNVYVKEVENTTLSSTSGKTDATIVYNGSLSIVSGEMEVSFSTDYEYQGGNLLVGFEVATKGTYKNAAFYGQAVGSSYSTQTYPKAQTFTPKTTITYEAAVEGPALKVSGYNNGDTFAFGLVESKAEKTLTLKNPGTEAVTVNVSTTGGFTATPSSVTINAKGEATLTITAPEAYGAANGTVSITPIVDGVDAISINLKADVKDPSKMFVDFSEGALPEGWEKTEYGGYGNYAWSFGSDANGSYACYNGTSSSYAGTLTSPLLEFEEDETLYFNTAKYNTSSYYTPSISIQVSTNGDSWSTVETFTNDVYGTWTTRSVTIPASTKYIRFIGWYIYLTNIYGGAYSNAPVMAVTASDHAFGMVDEAAETTFTIQNKGKSTLTDVSVVASSNDFTITGAPATIAAGEEVTVTVTMSAATAGAKEGTITVSAPEQETVTFNVSGYVMDNTLFTETFDGNALPDGWENSGWTFSNGAAVGSYSYGANKILTTPALTVAEGEKMALEVRKVNSGNYTLPIYVSKDGGDFALHQTIAAADLDYLEYRVFFIEGLEAGSYQIRFMGDGVQINAVNGFHLDENAPLLSVSPTTDAAFGKKTASDSKEYTITNTGTGTLVVDIASNSSDFTVSPAHLEVTDEPQTFTITFNYAEGNYGPKEGVITITPTYNEDATVTINALAKAVDPNAWDEDFEEGEIPLGWEANNFTVGAFDKTALNNTKVAKATNKGGTLTTPRLEAKAGDVLTWEAYIVWSDEGFTVEYSNDEKGTWTAIDGYNPYKPENDGITANGSVTEMSFTAPADGFYYLRFTSTWANNAVDNFNGLKLALKDHDVQIASQSIPSSRTQYQDITVRVAVSELVGKDEEVTVKFFINGEQYGEDVVETVEGGTTKEISVTFTPTEAITGEAWFTVENENISLTSEPAEITINAALTLDETVAPESIPTNSSYGTTDVVVVKYTPKAGWNTIALPFRMYDADLTTIFGEGWKAYEFNSYSDGALGFKVASSFYAGYPYIIYAPNADPTNNQHIFKVVSVSTATAKNDSYGGATFQGTFAPIAAPDMEGKYGVVPSTGRIQKGSASASLKGYRAYFELPADADPAKISLDFGDGVVITGIEGLQAVFGETGDVYDLNGRKVADAKTAKTANLPKGVYIQNGKKLVIK